MKRFTTFSLLTLTVAALAQPVQTKVEKATFGMAKATLEFLATDTRTFPNAQQTTCTNCSEYGDLAAFIQKNNLKKADGLLSDIKKQSQKLTAGLTAKVFPDEASMLDSLQRYIVGRVTGGAERAHRLGLASFAAYETKLSDLAAGADTGPADTEQVAALQESSATADETDTSRGGFAWGTWAFWLSVLNLLGLGYLLLLTRGQNSRPKVAQADREADRLAGLQDDNKRLSSTVTDLANRLAAAEKKLTMLATPSPATHHPAQAPPRAGQAASSTGNVPREAAPAAHPVRPAPAAQPNPASMPLSGMSQMGAPGQQPTQLAPSSGRPAAPAPPAEPNRPMSGGDSLGNLAGTLPTTNVPAAERPAANPPAAPPQPPAAPTRFYARTADLGNGFSLAGLLTQPERGTVYDIELTSPTTATFRVSQLAEAQQLAMSDPYSYLSDACLYENQPGGPNSRIQTVAPGQLVMQTDKWHITEKARIGFM